MDDKLVPLMVLLAAALVAGVAYSLWAYWRDRRAVAWNVVQAALTRRHLSAEQAQTLERAVQDQLALLRMTPETLARLGVAVRYAVEAAAMRQLGIAPFQATRPFAALRSPYLARSVAQHIRVVRFHVENAHGIVLSELDAATSR